MAKTTQVSEAVRSLADSGGLSQAAAKLLATPDRDVQTPDVAMGYEEPAFACFLIDASGSMKPFAQSVIQGQQRAVQALRQSHKAKKGALYAAQWTFSTKIKMLNSFSVVDRAGADNVVMLDDNSYNPNERDSTALYSSTFHVLQEIATAIDHARKTGIRSSCTIALITDGEDTDGGARPADIRTIVGELKAKKYLARSIVIGIRHANLPPERIEEIKTELGFDEAVSVEKSDREIRRAFVLMSQSAVTAPM